MRSKSGKGDLAQHRVPEVFQMPLLGSLDLYETTVKDLQQYMSNGELSSLDYVTHCLERIRVVRLLSSESEIALHQESLLTFHRALGESLSRSGHRSKPRCSGHCEGAGCGAESGYCTKPTTRHPSAGERRV